VTLEESLSRFVPADEGEAADLERIRAFLARHKDPFDRRIREGHLTGSAITVSASGERVLLLHHRKLIRWLQPGGHAEPGETCGEEVALREAREETGIEGLVLHPEAPRPLDVDVHMVPERRGEPAHEHLDLRYLVVAPEGAEAAPSLREARAIRWFSWEDLSRVDLDRGLLRALGKARRLLRRD
jgi:8-oxo-dGTP pyrophosphatase MutT (NUDIX family)